MQDRDTAVWIQGGRESAVSVEANVVEDYVQCIGEHKGDRSGVKWRIALRNEEEGGIGVVDFESDVVYGGWLIEEVLKETAQRRMLVSIVVAIFFWRCVTLS